MSEFVTLANTKSYLQITGTASDSLITLFTDIVEDEVQKFIGTTLTRNTYTEVVDFERSRFDATDYYGLDTRLETQKFFLKNRPVSDVTIIAAGATVTSSQYTVYSEAGYIDFGDNTPPYKPTVSYTAGYTTATAPASLQGVIYQGVYSMYENFGQAKRGGGDVTSKKIKDFSVSYGDNQSSYLRGFAKTYLESNKHVLRNLMNVDL